MILIDRRYFRYFDWISFGLIILLSLIGLLFIYSATLRLDQPLSIYIKKQTFGLISGLGIYFVLCTIDYRTLWRWGYFLYFAVIGLLIVTIIKGSFGMGAQRWIHLGLVKFQPSELAKLFFPAFFTTYLYVNNDTHRYTLKKFFPILAILGINTLLILKQPDLGTALIILFSGLILLWFIGIPKKFFLWSALLALICMPLAWRLLRPYQKQRIAVFLGEGQAHKERYQIEQSTIAIGSGGLLGKGFLKGTQNKLMFLPESRTDFIFSVICEEGGFVTAFIIILLYALLFLRLLYITSTIDDFFVRVLALGLIIHLILSTVINMGMVIGLLPIVGIPLPFMSYGISNLWITLASLGWFNGIAIRRFYL